MKALISGGGTGGHIFPALSIAGAVKRRWPDAEILFVGAEGRMEMERVPAAGYNIEGLPVAGFDRKRLWRNIPVVWRLMRSLVKARRIVKEFSPDIAIGVGGYASGPVLKEAQRRGIPTLVQEQNSYPGVTNKLLARKAHCICVAYEGTERYFPAEKIILTGNPMRKELSECALSREEAKRSLGFAPEQPLVFVTGGSLGAHTINRAVAEALPLFERKGASLFWQTGRSGADEFQPLAEGKKGVRAVTFVDRMEIAYRAADIVVARAGASTISELQNLGKAAILIPSPNVAEDHQRHNAEALSTRGAAEMILDREAVELLPARLEALIDSPELRTSLESNAAAMALHGADDRIAAEIARITGL
ncbi:MAG: undecaprenyldiphospho-muramoylpentapeptide beta-N-acetylglucosaminyltransferase [Duncaniella sp.]|nr:undecaprenyldiphospho-muramoylpentapeptide beta-N-acetylglucosaminyltransferase [Duncaniella sp.]